MRKSFKIVLFSILLIGIGTSVYQTKKYIKHESHTAPVPTAHIAFVNLTRLNTEAKAFIQFKELIKRQYNSFHEEILSKEKKLQSEYEEIRQIEKNHPEQAKELKTKKDDLDHQVSDLDKILKSRKESLNKSFDHIREEIELAIRDIVTQVAKRRGFNLVFNATILDASVVLYGGSELDITDEVLQELNHKLPTVHLPS